MTCPVCNSEDSRIIGPLAGKAADAIECQRCGKYSVTTEALGDYLVPRFAGSRLSKLNRAVISYFIRSSQQKPPMLTSDYLKNLIEKNPKLPSRYSQAQLIVKYVGNHLESGEGKIPSFQPDFTSSVGCLDFDDACELALELVAKGILVGVDASAMGRKSLMNIGLTLDGWSDFENIRSNGGEGSYCFVALQFGDVELDEVIREQIRKPVHEELGIEILDMRDLAQAGIIDNIMRDKIRGSRFVIADLSHDNRGAYWEAGYAEGLGKPVIYICKGSKFDEVTPHFDVNHSTIVMWGDGYENFAEELVATIRRTVSIS